jgi:hypothetical protein
MRPEHDPYWHERGFLFETPVGGAIFLVALAVFTVTVVTLAGSPRLDRLAAQEEARRRRVALPVAAPAAPAPKVIPETFRDFPAPPTANPDCVKAVLKLHGTVSHNGFSWVDTADPAPPVNTPAAAAWRGRMSAKVGAIWADFRERGCDKEPARLPAAPPPPKEDPRFKELLGTYYLRAPVVPGVCLGLLPSALKVDRFQSGTEIEVTLVPSGGASPSGRFLAFINGYTFRLSVPERHLSMQGTFIGQSGDTIVEGVFSYDVGGGCTVEFQGTRTRPSP